MSKKYSEKIVSFWRFGYFYLSEYGERGYLNMIDKDGSESEWKKLFWRFYWRVF